MNTEERKQLRSFCQRVLEAQNRHAFIQCADELLMFLDAVLPCEKSEPKLSIVSRSSL